MQANVKSDAPARGVDGEPLSELELGAWRGMLGAHAAMTRRLDASCARATASASAPTRR